MLRNKSNYIVSLQLIQLKGKCYSCHGDAATAEQLLQRACIHQRSVANNIHVLHQRCCLRLRFFHVRIFLLTKSCLLLSFVACFIVWPSPTQHVCTIHIFFFEDTISANKLQIYARHVVPIYTLLLYSWNRRKSQLLLCIARSVYDVQCS